MNFRYSNTRAVGALVALVMIAAIAVVPELHLSQLTNVVTVVARWFLIAVLAFVFGGIVLAVLVLAHPALNDFREYIHVRYLTWLRAALLIAFIVGVCETVLANPKLESLSSLAMLARSVLLMVVWWLLSRRGIYLRLTLLPAGLLLLTRSLQSHAAYSHDWIMPVLADWAHFIFASVWLGGVAMLALVVVPMAMEPQPRLKEMGVILSRFSPIALFCVFAVAITGIAQSAAMVGSVEALLYTDYRRTLLVKIGLLLVLIGFGAFHQQVIAPRLQAWRLRDADNALVAARRLRWSIVAEFVFSAVLLAVVGLLVSLPLPMQTL